MYVCVCVASRAELFLRNGDPSGNRIRRAKNGGFARRSGHVTFPTRWLNCSPPRTGEERLVLSVQRPAVLIALLSICRHSIDTFMVLRDNKEMSFLCHGIGLFILLSAGSSCVLDEKGSFIFIFVGPFCFVRKRRTAVFPHCSLAGGRG